MSKKPNFKEFNELPAFMTKGGPGDTSTGGNINTDAWFAEDHMFDPRTRTYIPGLLKKGTLAQKAKDQEIFFCDIPFTQLYMEIDGRYQACCFAHPSSKHSILNTGMKEWFIDSEEMNAVRSEMLDPDSDYKQVNHTCQRCIADEDRYGRSRRTACMKIHSNDATHWGKIDRTVQQFIEDGKLKFNERLIEVQLKVYGSECNLDCYMCDHNNSTIRQKVRDEGVWNDAIWGKLTQLKLDITNWVVKDKTDIKLDKDVDDQLRIPIMQETYDITNTKPMIDQTLALAPYIRSIKIIGGEPLIMKKHYELLDRLIESGDAEHIYLKYQTNLTETKVGKHNIFNYIPRFKRVSMVASVDGIGKTIEYMRRRCSWDKIVENAEISNTYDNVDVDFNGLVSFLSVMRFYEVTEWCLNEGKDIIDQVNWAMLEWPTHLRVNMLPEKIKKDLIPKYEKWPDIQEALRLPAETIEMDERLGSNTGEKLSIQNTFDYLLDVDKYYEGTKWEMHLFEVFPELEEYYIPKELR